MNFLTSNKSISITVIASLILLGFFYIAGTTKKTPVPDGNLPPVTKTDGLYSAFQGVQSPEAVYLSLKLDKGTAELTSRNLADNKPTVEAGTYKDTATTLSVSLTSKDGQPQPSARVLEFTKTEDTLTITNIREAGFGPQTVMFYKPKQELANTSWYWERSEYANDTKVEPADKTKFKLTFKPDGSFDSSTDCNSLSGNYYIAGTEIKFTTMMSTLMFCDGSLESEYSKDLREIYTYMLEGDKLVLTLPIDSGTMQFIKAQN